MAASLKPLLVACGAAVLLAGPAAFAAETDGRRPYAVSLFGARMTDRGWHDVLTLDNVGYFDTYLAGVAVSRHLADLGRSAELEVEGQLVRHFGEQRHWEVNAALVARWHQFPWDDTVDTSVAWGIGPSYATQIPPNEVARWKQSSRLLVYWVAEVEAGPPDSDWSSFARLHHRSGAFGVVAEEGGSNWITLGIRRRF